MKWYKHLSGSLNNSFTFDLVEKFGGDGYMVFFGTLEIMADEFDIHNPGLSCISIKKLTTFSNSAPKVPLDRTFHEFWSNFIFEPVI